MLERLRSIFGREEAAPEIGLNELGPLLREEMQGLEERLAESLQQEKVAVVDAIKVLEEALARMKSREREIASHPKLEKIARSSLPAFLKAMEQQLHRTLPEEPQAFYQEAAGMLKGCITASRGSGKYLHAVLPEEMRQVREGIGTLGRCVNRMTALLKETEGRRRELAALEHLLEGLSALEKERARIEDRLEKNRLEEDALARRAVQIEGRRGALRQSAEFRQLEEIRRSLEVLAQEEVLRKQRVERYIAISLGVFRRACTVSRRLKGGSGDSALENAVKRLEQYGGSGTTGIAPLWRDAMAAARSLIEGGQLVLKGAEERELFSGGDTLAQEAIAAFESLERLLQEKGALEERIAASPARMEEGQLQDALVEIEAARRRLLKDREELEHRSEELRVRIGRGREELARAVKASLGRVLAV